MLNDLETVMAIERIKIGLDTTLQRLNRILTELQKRS